VLLGILLYFAKIIGTSGVGRHSYKRRVRPTAMDYVGGTVKGKR
jgi:hypothetical protein